MAPTHSTCFCNNRGGVGKTFMAFQTACEAARSRPDANVLVVDFSLYSDVTALLLGGSAREGFGAPMKGLQVTVENTTADTRAEGLIRDLELAIDADDDDDARAGMKKKTKGSVFGAFFSKPSPAAAASSRREIDLQKYMIRPAAHNPAIPPNLYLIPSAGAVSWTDTQETNDDAAAAAANDDEFVDAMDTTDRAPLWTRKGDAWHRAGARLARALDDLPPSFDAVFVDTDHLAACVLTKLALASCESVVVPLSFDDGDFNRLFQDVTGNALFTDVMIPMKAKGQLRARVKRMVFSKVGSNKNEAVTTAGGIESPFKPSKTVMDQMDAMAQQVWAACTHDERYKQLFAGAEELAPGQYGGGNIVGAFTAKFFTAMKMAPDLAANLSKMMGLPLCTMTSRTYHAPSGLEGQSGKPVLDSLKSETQRLVAGLLDDRYNLPLFES